MYSLIAPTAPATRSAPSCAGLSILMFKPVLMPGPSSSGTMSQSIETAREIALPTVGTTDAITQSSIFWYSSP